MINAFNANAAALSAKLNTEATRELRFLLLHVAAGRIVPEAVLEKAACAVWWDVALPQGF